MILIFGGTTEGRTAAETLDEAGQPFYYSTRGTLQEVTCRNMTRLTGNMDSEKIISFCREHDIRLIIDAAHPFAQQLHLNIFLAAKELTIKVVWNVSIRNYRRKSFGVMTSKMPSPV